MQSKSATSAAPKDVSGMAEYIESARGVAASGGAISKYG
jgi:hypothetical protein